MQIQIREIAPDEVTALAVLAAATYTAAFGHTFSADDLAAHLERNLSEAALRRAIGEDAVLVAVVENRLVGFIQFGAAKTDTERALTRRSEIRRLYVLSDFNAKASEPCCWNLL